jgi:hypothetical protein
MPTTPATMPMRVVLDSLLIFLLFLLVRLGITTIPSG